MVKMAYKFLNLVSSIILVIQFIYYFSQHNDDLAKMWIIIINLLLQLYDLMTMAFKYQVKLPQLTFFL